MIGAGGGAEDASRNRVTCGWAKFHDSRAEVRRGVQSESSIDRVFRRLFCMALKLGLQKWRICNDWKGQRNLW